MKHTMTKDTPNPTFTVHLQSHKHKIGLPVMQTLIPEYALEIAHDHKPHPDYDHIIVTSSIPDETLTIYTRYFI